MEENRDQEELKHVCKLCNKRYPSGKSLGGHMRSHVIANSHKNKPIIPKKVTNNFDYVEYEDDEDDDEEDEDDNDNEIAVHEGKNSGYGLRENPKKTWRLVEQLLHFQTQHHHHQQQQQQERVCKQCGKGFQSLKALCGHMSSHSDNNNNNKERNFKEEDDYSWSSYDDDDDSYSDNNNNNNVISNSNSKRQTRSSLTRYRSLTGVDSLSPNGNGGGSSSNHSEIDHEQEEVAMCLMMLSRDSYSSANYKPCFNFTAESSDNNSVILEGGSSSNYVGIASNKRKDFCLIKDNNKKKIKKGNVNHEMDNSDSGYFENGAKELESDDSVESFNYENSDSRKSRVREMGNFRFDSPESDENSSKKMMKQDYNKNCYFNSKNVNHPPSKKGSKYECDVCKKTFKTHQALGGHIISHKKNNNGENSLLETKISAKKVVIATNTKIMPSKSKKGKGHICPYCPKVFKSGQALGGHKRSHMMGVNNVGNFNNLPPRLEPQHHKQPPLLDLNLPAPMDEEGSGSGSGSGNSQFMAW
ncbi:Zinc finger protein ZAT9 [Bienertia sinuspersici]